MIYRDGTKAVNGDIIKWYCWDNDDYVTWTMFGIYRDTGVIYLGGGVDFGTAVGKVYSIDEVQEEALNNDYGYIERVCWARGLTLLLSKLETINE